MTKYFGILRRSQDLSIKLSRFRAMSHNMEGGNERSEMIKKVEEASKLNPERLKKVDGWKDLWENNTYPWHKDEIHPNLIKNLQTLIEATGKTDNKDIRFFVPLCGKTKDLLFLKSQGFQVIGCEGVEKAVVDFFNENSLEFSKTDLSADGTTSFTSKDGKLNIVKGDYFKLTPELLGGKIDCVWDRGSLVAIDVAMRPKYAEIMVSLLNDKFGYLLATIQREVEPENVVPHSASFDDIKSMFGNHFSVHLMEQKKITDSNMKDNTFVIAPDKTKDGEEKEDRLDMWRQRWDNSNTGWHKTEVNPHLIQFFDYLTNGKEKIKILFPLSGKCIDLVHCYKMGHTVYGIEGVPLAVEEMYRQGGLTFSRTFCQEIDGFIYKSEDSRLVVFACDFFKVKAKLLLDLHGLCDAVYDRGAFEAIFETDRKAYIQAILSFLQPADFRYIVNCFEYDEHEDFKGPPRACPRAEMFQLFNGHTLQPSKLTTNTEILSIEDYTDYGKKWNLKAMTKIVYGIKPSK